jgi:hypothetical protein
MEAETAISDKKELYRTMCSRNDRAVDRTYIVPPPFIVQKSIISHEQTSGSLRYIL